MKFAVHGSVAALLMLLPTASAFIGTELDPEMLDKTGDVEYDPLYLGAREQSYLDVVAAWWHHDEATGGLTVFLKVSDARALQSLRPENAIRCQISAAFATEGQTWGQLFASVGKGAGGTILTSSAQAVEHSGGTGYHDPIDLKHRFNTTLSEPGYFARTFEPALLRHYGDELLDLGAQCVEWGSPAARFVQLYYNRDGGSSRSAYSVKDLRRLAGPDGARDPIEAHTASPEPTPTPIEKATHGLGLVSALLLFAAYAFLKRRNA